MEPIAIRRVEDASGQLVRAWVGGASAQVVSPQVAYLITDILSDDGARMAGFGEGSVLKLSRPAAAKTGTTTDWRDNWVVGYTPNLVAGVWVGNADNTPMYDVSGISGAGPIWHDFMEEVHTGQPMREFERPEGLVEAEVCGGSGLQPGPACPLTRTESFVAGTEPIGPCTLHQRVRLDRATGALASEDTPSERIVEQLYFVMPAEAREWALENGLPQPPAATSVSVGTSAGSGRGLCGDQPGCRHDLPTERPELPRSSQRIVIAARPAEGIHAVEVELYLNNEVLARLHSYPYEARWELTLGQHTVWARDSPPMASGWRAIVCSLACVTDRGSVTYQGRTC